MHYFLKFVFGIKLYMFRIVPLSIIRNFSLYTQQWYMSYSLLILILLASYMTYTIAVSTVKNSWWWAEELSETFRVYSKNKIEKLVHLVGFIIRITLLLYWQCGCSDKDKNDLGNVCENGCTFWVIYRVLNNPWPKKRTL